LKGSMTICPFRNHSTKREKGETVDRKIRVLAAKVGLDGHDRGIKVVCNALRNAGMEVIYTGLRQTPEQIVNTGIQEDVDVIAISILSGAHNKLLPKVAEMLQKNSADLVMLIAGGVIPEADLPFLKEKGFKKIFGPGTSTAEIIQFIKQGISERKEAGCAKK